jgi:hypothetical protein
MRRRGNHQDRAQGQRKHTEGTTAVVLTIHQIGPANYPQYAEIDASFEVASVLKVVPKDNGLARRELRIVNSEYRIGQ